MPILGSTPPALLRPSPLACRPRCQHLPHTSNRNATLIPRPHRPYQFSQLLTLSDGSTFVHRTTSPLPVYRSGRDARNNPLWNPSNKKLANVEEDEAGRLRAFRRRFGRGWDAEAVDDEGGQSAEGEKAAADGQSAEAAGKQRQDDADPGASLMDLISSYGQDAGKGGAPKSSANEARNSGKGKGGQK